jgi:tetratricopeptide (TPR) repeat protein
MLFFVIPAMIWVLIAKEQKDGRAEEHDDKSLLLFERAKAVLKKLVWRVEKLGPRWSSGFSTSLSAQAGSNNIDSGILAMTRRSKVVRWLLTIIISGLTVYCLWLVVGLLRADLAYQKAVDHNQEQELTLALSEIRQAIKLRPNEPAYLNELADISSQLAGDITSQGNLKLAGELAGLAINASSQALSISPQNVNLWKNRGLVFIELAGIEDQVGISKGETGGLVKEDLVIQDEIQPGPGEEKNPLRVQDKSWLITKAEALRQAESALEIARQLAPTDPKILYNLALVKMRRGDGEEAIVWAEKSLELKSDYQDGLLAAALFWHDRAMGEEGEVISVEDHQKAIEYLERLNEHHPDDQVQERLEKWRGENTENLSN